MLRKGVFLCLLALQAAITPSPAQNSYNYMEVNANTMLIWGLNTVNEIENNQTIQGALTIRVRNLTTPPSYRAVYVRCSYVIAPPGFSVPYIPLQLDYTSDNSPHETNLITTPLDITTTNQRLFTHRRHSYGGPYSFNYNLVHKATDWEFAPGLYIYVLTFTFTNP